MEWAYDIVGQYGYWAVFIWTFIEGETVFLAAAALASAGIMQPWKVIVVAAGGAFAGHMFFFALGRWRGYEIIHRFPMLERHYPKANKILDHYAHWSIFIFQYLYGTRLVAAILFGASKLDFKRFFFLQMINCMTWSLIIYAIGHMLGLAGVAVLRHFGIWGLFAAAAVTVAVFTFIYYRYGSRRIQKFFEQD